LLLYIKSTTACTAISFALSSERHIPWT
jgi:hypothetical protein